MSQVDHPKHYNTRGMECIEFVELLPFNLGNAVKYIWRAGEKDDIIQDYEKAEWYLKRFLHQCKDVRVYMTDTFYKKLENVRDSFVSEQIKLVFSYLLITMEGMTDEEKILSFSRDAIHQMLYHLGNEITLLKSLRLSKISEQKYNNQILTIQDILNYIYANDLNKDSCIEIYDSNTNTYGYPTEISIKDDKTEKILSIGY